MTNPLIMKLAHGAALTDEDRALISQHTSRGRQVGPRQDLIHEGDRPENVHLVMEGLACRYKLLPDGRRQIVALLRAGRLLRRARAILGEMDHSIATLSACRIVDVPQASIEAVTELSPRITRALWWATLVDEGILRAWLVNMGRRSADQQIAHLFCELLVRLEAAGLSTDDSRPTRGWRTRRLQGAPWAASADHLGLEQADDASRRARCRSCRRRCRRRARCRPRAGARCSEWRRIAWLQLVVATPVCADRSTASRASAGVRQSSVLRGLALSAAATAARSPALCAARSVPFGKYWRSSPFVFSFVPRCHGLCGSQKYTCRPVSIRSRGCSVISAP